MSETGWTGRRQALGTPTTRLALVLVVGLLAVLFAWRATLQQPAIGAVAPGFELASGPQPMRLEPLDLTPEPGELTSYAELDRFYQRQDQIAALAAMPGAALAARGQPPQSLDRRRTLADTPGLFWIQAVVGFGALLISGWVWALRPRDLASSLFALSGLSTLAFTLSAAVYSTRALAIPAATFKALSLTNMIGASVFGVAMIGLFLVYPRRLPRWRTLMALNAIAFLDWTALAALRWLPSAQLGGNLITLVEMVFILVAIVAQHRATRREAQARAALTWLGLSVLIGAGGFIVLSAAPAALGLDQPIDQGFAFLFFLIIYLGLAAGLRRYRLFDVGQWGLRVLFYTLGAGLILLLDGALLVAFGLERAPAFGLSILAVSLLYLPLRDQLWRWTTRRRPMAVHDTLAAALDVAFAPSSTQRAERWSALLQRAFDPLRIEPATEPVAAPRADPEGVSLSVPPVAGAGALTLSFPHAGRALFRPADLKLATQLVALTTQAEQGRQAYDRGVLEERRRMAQDLHDDVGARLLTGLHAADAALKPTLQAAISDIRAIVSGITGDRATLERLLGDMRYEVARRVEAAGLGLDWPLLDGHEGLTFDYRQHKALTSAVREVVSNTLRHSGAKWLTVRTEVTGDALVITLADDGEGIPAAALEGAAAGYGLKSLVRRLADIGGRCDFASTDKGATVILTAPLRMGPQ